MAENLPTLSHERYDALGPRSRLALQLYASGLMVAEVAAETGLTAVQVGTALTAAKAALGARSNLSMVVQVWRDLLDEAQRPRRSR